MSSCFAWDLRPLRDPMHRAYATNLVLALRRLGPSHEHLMVETGGEPPANIAVLVTFDGFVSPKIPTVAFVLTDAGGGIGIAQRWRIARTAAMADLVVAPSERVREGLVRVLKVPARKVVAGPPVLAENSSRPSRSAVQAAQVAARAPERYFASPRPEQIDAGVAWLHLPTDASEEDTRCLVAGAVAFVDPSPVEGVSFGGMQALACGTPAMVRRGSALEEPLDGAGIAVEPKRADEWRSGMRLLAAKSGLRSGLSKRALEVASGFANPLRVTDLAFALNRLRSGASAEAGAR